MISQLDKDDVEAVGLVKFDFLGLTTLTILDWAERFVRGLGEAGFALEKIPLDDAATYKLLSAGNTTAVFQLESRGMRDMIRRARPDRFEDIIALVALYRPGPMDLIPEFIERKHGKARRVSRSAPGTDPGPDLRDHGVPGAGDADRAGGRRLHAGRRRPAAPRDGQEEGRGDGRSSATSSSPARRRTA